MCRSITGSKMIIIVDHWTKERDQDGTVVENDDLVPNRRPCFDGDQNYPSPRKEAKSSQDHKRRYMVN